MVEAEFSRFQEVLAKRKTREERVALIAALASSKVFSREVKPVAMLFLLYQLQKERSLSQVLALAKREGALDLFAQEDDKTKGTWTAFLHRIVQKQKTPDLSKSYLELYALLRHTQLTQDRGHLFDQLAFAPEPYRWSQEEMGAYADITYKDFYDGVASLQTTDS